MTKDANPATPAAARTGRKGGSVFPRLKLADALTYAKKLVSKTHTGAQPQEVILSGVVGSRSGAGRIRMSGLKQYGLLLGDSKSKYTATELAKSIDAAPAEEAIPLYRHAALKPTIFKKLFDTFHGDSVSKAKLKQQAAALNVHPEETSTCVDLYVASMVTAKLATVNGDQVLHLAASELSAPIATSDTEPDEGLGPDVESDSDAGAPDRDGQNDDSGERVSKSAQASGGDGSSTPRAIFNVSVTLDSSLDTEKLQKQLELLKRYGAI